MTRVLAIFLVCAGPMLAQGVRTGTQGVEATPSAADPLQQRIPAFELEDESVLDGFAKLSQMTNLALSVEHRLAPSIQGTAYREKRWRTKLSVGSLAELLQALCNLSGGYVWELRGNTINVYPREYKDVAGYLLNRTITNLKLTEVPDAEKALFQTVAQLPGSREQIAVLQSGGSLAFAKPWSVSFQNISVRDALNEIARRLGPTYGWQFTGAQDFRIVMFHQRLRPGAPPHE